VPKGMGIYAQMCGWTLARGHARSGDPVAIAAYLGNKDVFDRAIAAFAVAYADRNERDDELLKEAVASGRLEAQTGLSPLSLPPSRTGRPAPAPTSSAARLVAWVVLPLQVLPRAPDGQPGVAGLDEPAPDVVRSLAVPGPAVRGHPALELCVFHRSSLCSGEPRPLPSTDPMSNDDPLTRRAGGGHPSRGGGPASVSGWG
jgi:Uncharacterized protein conserved in bacteria (DUF2252)